MDCACDKQVSVRHIASGRVRAKVNLLHNGITRFKSSSSISNDIEKQIAQNVRIRGIFDINTKTNQLIRPTPLNTYDNSNIRGDYNISGVIRSRLSSVSNLSSSYVDKINTLDITKYTNQSYLEKLYPISDVETSLNNTYFVNKNLSSGNLYQSIDEGIIDNNTDKLLSYIQPSSIFTEGSFRYRCKVSPSLIRPEESILLIRASAPLATYSSYIPPIYRISNIKLEDASGNLIIQYENITVRGDADYNDDNYVNFTTYLVKPSINYANQNTWKNYYPSLGSGLLSQAYSLNLDFDVECIDNPFSEGFNTGYSEGCDLPTLYNSGVEPNNYLALDGSPLSTRTEGYYLNPNNTIRITAIEICNSGASVTLTDHYLPFYNEVSSTGLRLTRDIYPSEVLLHNFDTTIYPSENSTWTSYPSGYSNINLDGTEILTAYLRDPSNNNYITLDSTSNIPDSGKLKLVFSHEPPQFVSQYTGGAFSVGGLKSTKDLDTAQWSTISEVDNFFTIDNIELKIIAKKSVGSRDYTIDVVGYSDDKILCSTPKIGGFLQNIEGSGYIPVSSGFNSIDDLGISSETLSDKTQFYSVDTTNNAGGDHYLISQTPVVTGTDFAEYTVPLKIYSDSVALGEPTDYTISSYFEKLYLDIFPLPSGASISHIKLNISYKPSNGLKLHTLGYGHDELFRRDITLSPTGDYVSTSGSLISNIPHSYSEDETTLKYNYATRWRGVFGQAVAGPFDPNQFDFSYYNPELITPFLNGYYSFNYDSGNAILADYSFETSRLDSVSSGTYIGSYSKIQNLGLRFKSQSLFNQATAFTTIDWTSISGYENHELKNRISDNFDNAIRVSGSTGYVNFGNINTSNGFAIFSRFSPDISMSGVSYNLWNSGVIFSKFDNGNNLEFALSYYNGKLRGSARNSSGSIITVNDDKYYYEYNYPLCAMLSYNENGDNKLRLFTNTLKDTSSAFVLHSGSSNLNFGYSSGSGVGINAFITDIGISTSSGTNILSSGSISLLNKEVLYSNFINGLENQLYTFIDDNVDAWHLGDFKICEFNQDFDRFTTRIGSDFIVHHLKHDGASYSQSTNYTLPSNINTSGIGYHTQIENDFLRFYLEDAIDVHEGFYSIQPRISKDLPRGYSFEEKAFVVESIIDHYTSNNITWSDGKLGPKLIVSLYTKNQNPKYRDDKINWGLINRHTHYLEPSGCYQKLLSTFSYNDIFNTDEPWANFDQDRNITELEHKYYSSDLNDMFLQYDLVYPSGSSFDSTIKLHSAQVKLENAIIKKLSKDDDLNLSIDGSGYQLGTLSLVTPVRMIDNLYGSPSGLFLYADANILGDSNNSINLYCSGMYHYNDSLVLHTVNFSTLNNELFCYTDGASGVASPMSLFVGNKLEDQSGYGELPLLIYQKEKIYDILNLNISSIETYDPILKEKIPLFTQVYTPSASLSGNEYNGLNLFIDTYDTQSLNSSLPLIVGKSFFVCNNINTGKSIDVDDNTYSSLSANDEIRGVETICFGSCDSNKGCYEQEIKTHDTVWFPESCFEGGLCRGSTTYTNLAASGFNTNIGYSGHYYGIRKFDNLIPNTAYLIELNGRSGSDTNITLPYQLDEVEYGFNNNATYSGIKLIGDAPYCESGRNIDDQYGKAVAVCDDLMAVGAPFHTLYDSGNYALDDAGAVFLYRRDPQPSGHTWIDHKAQWKLEKKLTLPSSILRDYYVDVPSGMNIDGQIYDITTRYWQVGQEGRQFGHSLSLTKNDNKETLVVGAPSAKFTRTFDQVQASGIGVGIFVFTDEFVPVLKSERAGGQAANYELTYNYILDSINGKDKVFQYFSDPPVKFDIKIIICEAIAGSTISSLDFPEPKPTFIVKQVIDRHRNEIIGSSDYNNKTNAIYSGIKQAFDIAFPYDSGRLNNNIPSILGFYVDDSKSLGERAVQPALDQFISYYQQYSFASGLKDFFGNQASGVTVKTVDITENWIYQSVDMLNTALDTGRLALNDEIKLFSSGIGPQYFNSSLAEFNIVPYSGGAVYVFENSSGEWDLKQTINSPTLLNTIEPDRFGHSVDISKNGELIVVGSPYINEAVMTYEYNQDSGQYINNFKYGYSDIPFTGSWGFLTEKYCPTSRLGYSVTSNEDGSIIAAGAPTDSMDEFDDNNTYYSPGREAFSVWPTYVNAGAVRVFESRQYFKHNKAIEYGIFGNLDYQVNASLHSGVYHHMSGIFKDIEVDYIKTAFDDVDIPQDAGLVIINTPSIDALSDEITQNILDWLALGDRNLVLVGNDPIWENEGIYFQSNNVLNKLLDRLNSRMRLIPARTEYESIPSSGHLNIIPSYRPRGSISSYLSPKYMYGSGTADIKVYSPLSNETFSCSPAYIKYNDKCNIPLKHYGDLRAEWLDVCYDFLGAEISYPINWPLHFGKVTPEDYGCVLYDASTTNLNKPEAVPIPILSAAEYESPTIVYPAVPETSGYTIVRYESVYFDTTLNARFGSVVDNTKTFEWSSNSGLNVNLINLNIGNTLSNSRFFQPEEFNNKQALLQAKASNKILTENIRQIVSDKTYFAAEENYGDTSSTIVLIAQTYLENQDTLLSGLGDKNINFFTNLISIDVNGQSCVAQLGDWTLNTNFTDAYSDSIIQQRLEDAGNIVDTNVPSQQLNIGHLTGEIILPIKPYNICWIANPRGLPNSSQIQDLVSWLSNQNNKLIITYENTAASAQIVTSLCRLLNISMRPLYLTEKSKFANNRSDRPYYYTSQNSICELNSTCLLLNTDHIASIGFRSQDTITRIENINVENTDFIPIKLGNATPIAYVNIPIEDNSFIDTGIWQLKTGITEVQFDVIPGSGYKIFVDIVSEDESENQPLAMSIANGMINPNSNALPLLYESPVYDLNENDIPYLIKTDYITYTTPFVITPSLEVIALLSPDSYDGNKKTFTFDVQIPSTQNKLTLYFSGNNTRLNSTSSAYTPKTTRLLAVSGCAVNVDIIPYDNFIPQPVFDWVINPAQPQVVVQIPTRLREISTESNKYCGASTCGSNFNNPLIADGPVVVAQELEQTSKFVHGVARSRITLIADSSLIQGPTIANENGVIHQSHKDFIQSLYPKTIFPSRLGKRSFNIQHKIMSPERGSPHIYFTSIGNSGLNTRFFDGSRNRTLSDFNDHITNYETFNRAINPKYSLDGDYTYLQPGGPFTEEEQVAKINFALDTFNSHAKTYGGTPKFSGIINGKMYEDIGCLGGMPQIMKDTGKDYIEFDYFKLGYPGNLFGYSIDLINDTLFIGAPFAAYSGEYITSWSGVKTITAPNTVPSGSLVGYNGGAGSVYIYKNTGSGITPYGKPTNWSCVKKIRPKSINIGQDISDIDLLGSGFYLGSNNYIGDDIEIDTKVSDQFGHTVVVNADTLAIGSPGHDFETYYENIFNSGEFVRKEFSFDMDIPQRNSYDLGESGIRNTLNGSGVSVLNNGAIYIYENRIVDFAKRKQDWTFVEKIVPQGYNSRLQKTYTGSQNIPVSGSENDRFGASIALHSTKRSDADYTIVVGVKDHKFATSGDHISSQPLSQAGAAYTYDIILKNQGYVTINPDSWIDARSFGQGSGEVSLYVSNASGSSLSYTNSGIVYSNDAGEIFLEVSGQDINSNGFIVHRPYVESLYGYKVIGTNANNSLVLSISGQTPVSSGYMDLYMNGPDSAIVYNNIGLYEFGVTNTVYDSGLYLYSQCPASITVTNSGLNLYNSGIGISTDNISLMIRGL
jgi:hypothetical protein